LFVYISVPHWTFTFYVLHLRLFCAIKDLLAYLLTYLLIYNTYAEYIYLQFVRFA